MFVRKRSLLHVREDTRDSVHVKSVGDAKDADVLMFRNRLTTD